MRRLYITSSGKWFWVWDDENKQQRGYQDIDILALRAGETRIISVTTNLDDKAGFNRNGEFDPKRLKRLKSYFKRSRKYLSSVDQYQWMINDARDIKYIVAYHTFSERKEKDIVAMLKKSGIETISAPTMLKKLIEFSQEDNIKIQDQVMRFLTIVNWHGSIEI